MKDPLEKLINPNLIRVNRSYMISRNFISKVDRKRKRCELRWKKGGECRAGGMDGGRFWGVGSILIIQ